MEFLTEKKDLALFLSIPFTFIALVFTIAYSFRNIKRIWVVGKPKPVDTDDESEKEEIEGRKGDMEDIDPVQYCEHIQSEVKKARQRVVSKQQKLSAEDLENEREVQRKQIEDIFKLMAQNNDKFGDTNQDELQQQMRLYV